MLKYRTSGFTLSDKEVGMKNIRSVPKTGQVALSVRGEDTVSSVL